MRAALHVVKHIENPPVRSKDTRSHANLQTQAQQPSEPVYIHEKKGMFPKFESTRVRSESQAGTNVSVRARASHSGVRYTFFAHKFSLTDQCVSLVLPNGIST